MVFGQSKPVRFRDYPAARHYSGKYAPLNLIPGTAAWDFRTRIREASSQKPNFAGHYILARWGCGAECLSYAIIDVKTGEVYFDDMTTCCYFSSNASKLPSDFEPIDFRLNSRLIIFTGLLDEEGSNGPHYFLFEGKKLSALR